MKKFKEIRKISEGWTGGRPHETGWVGKYIKHSGGYGKVTSEHPTHVQVFNGVSHYPVMKHDVYAHHIKGEPDSQLEDAGAQTAVGSESYQPEELDKKVDVFFEEATILSETKKNHLPEREWLYADHDADHAKYGAKHGIHLVHQYKGHKLQIFAGKDNRYIGVVNGNVVHRTPGTVAGRMRLAKHLQNHVDKQSNEEIREDLLINEAKKKKFLGQFRGKTATGQKANPIDVDPKLHLNKGKALKAVRSKGF